jgi:uncharacterized protein (TIGR02444 family)
MTDKVSLWDYACTLYRQPSVEGICLELQDEYQMNIPLLLFLCWTGRYVGALTLDEQQQSHEIAKQWQSLCIQPLRCIRSKMKCADVNSSFESVWSGMRETVKQAELEAEKSLLQILEARAVVEGHHCTSEHTEVYLMNSLHNIYQSYPHLTKDQSWIARIVSILCAAQPQMQYDNAFALACNLATSPVAS